MMKLCILDGYVDEPTCLGVPPYISPYPRYIAGAIWTYDKSARINYITIDQLRNEKSYFETLSKSNIVIAIAGMAVPGRYLSGYPASPKELVSIMSSLSKPIKILSGPAARYGFGMIEGKKTKEIDFVKDVFNLIAKNENSIASLWFLEKHILNFFLTILTIPRPVSNNRVFDTLLR